METPPFLEYLPELFKSYPSRADIKALFGEVLFILGHNVFVRLFASVKIAGMPHNIHTESLKFLKTEIEKSYVIGLELEYSVLLEKSAVDLKKASVRESALRVSLLGPRVAEVEIDAVERVRLYVLGE
jgi:hypothetical protein